MPPPEKRPPGPTPPRAPPPPRTSSGSDPDKALYALLFFIALAIGGYFLLREVKREKYVEDCLAAGLRNCDPDHTPVAPDR